MNADITPDLRRWLDETISSIPDPVHIYPAVAADAHGSSQQRRWIPAVAGHWRWSAVHTAGLAVVLVAVVLFSGLLLLAEPLGRPGSDVPEAGAFSPAGDLDRETAVHTATLLPDGRVLVVGGHTLGSEARVWDPVTASFAETGSLAQARSLHTASLLPDGRVLAIGGSAGGTGLAAAEAWEPETDTFTQAGSLAQPRHLHTATLLPDDRVLVVGGQEYHYHAGLRSAEVWDDGSEAFGPAGSLAEGRWGHSATLLPDGRVLVVGGWALAYPGGVTATAEVWDPAKESFAPAGSLAVARASHTATLLPDGRVLVVGGELPSGDATVASHSGEVWDPETESFSPAGSLGESRYIHSATLLPDGRVLIAGGVTTDELPVRAAEVWDPTRLSFDPAGSLVRFGRLYHTATRLLDGRVLVIGGEGSGGSAEVWAPRVE